MKAHAFSDVAKASALVSQITCVSGSRVVGLAFVDIQSLRCPTARRKAISHDRALNTASLTWYVLQSLRGEAVLNC